MFVFISQRRPVDYADGFANTKAIRAYGVLFIHWAFLGSSYWFRWHGQACGVILFRISIMRPCEEAAHHVQSTVVRRVWAAHATGAHRRERWALVLVPVLIDVVLVFQREV